VDRFNGDWWLVHTRPRQEKALAADLGKLGIGYFLPLLRTRRRYRQRALTIEFPLFPSYLFMCGGTHERYETLMTHRAAAVIAVANQAQLKHELRSVHRVTSGDGPLQVFRGLKRGHKCRVRSGRLAGVEGVVLKKRDRCRLFVGIEVLGQSAVLEIAPALIEPIDQ
jgi:transcriptional antiterminator RfaH